MPIEDNRKPIGIFENKRHKNVSRKAEQRMVNYISDHTGKQPTRKGLKTAVGMLYAFSLFQNFKLEEEMPINREQFKKTVLFLRWILLW